MPKQPNGTPGEKPPATGGHLHTLPLNAAAHSRQEIGRRDRFCEDGRAIERWRQMIRRISAWGFRPLFRASR